MNRKILKNQLDIHKHPCFNENVKGRFGRVHLPVAPKCNIQCNYCNRKYDCVNESRPGVTSAVLSPTQALHYMEQVLEKHPSITTVGIAGPGDPMANPKETLTTLKLVRQKWPHLLLCLASNGLNLPPYLDELAELGVSHVTLTINAVDTKIGQQFYAWVRDNKIIYRGLQAAELLLARQMESIQGLKERGIIVKANTIIVPWLNDRHAVEVAEKMLYLGVDLMNCMPMHPNPDTLFADIPEPSHQLMAMIRNEAEHYVPQMRHCARCRADAVGLLAKDNIDEFSNVLSACSKMPADTDDGRPYVAVATLEGALVNQHLGRASHLIIYKEVDEDYVIVETRKTPEPGTAGKRWFDLAEILKDCKAVVVSAVGETPETILEEHGIRVIEMYGLIEDGLDIAFKDKKVRGFQKRKGACLSGGCRGTGEGCG